VVKESTEKPRNLNWTKRTETCS